MKSPYVVHAVPRHHPYMPHHYENKRCVLLVKETAPAAAQLAGNIPQIAIWWIASAFVLMLAVAIGSIPILLLFGSLFLCLSFMLLRCIAGIAMWVVAWFKARR